MNYQEALNDLIEINNDRIEGYKKASTQTNNSELVAIFLERAKQSKNYADTLRQVVESKGNKAAEGTTMRGKIYRTWMDIKSTFGNDDQVDVLESCEYGEDAAKEAYEEVLEEELPEEIRTLLQNQYNALLISHNHIRTLRDKAKDNNNKSPSL